MPSNNVPNPQSYEQILGDALSSYAAKVGIDDFNVGSAVTSFFEVVALVAARSSGDIFQVLVNASIDRATGSALQNLAIENGVTPLVAKVASGMVTVTDNSFTKISTKIYSGAIAPNVNSTQIAVSDASQFPSSGAVYIGRGTTNVEGPIYYSTAPVQTGNFWVITLNTGTTKYHNLSETVILAQGGNRAINVNTIVTAPAIGSNPDLQYSVTTAAIILDGETTVANVPVSASQAGSSGNIPIGAIQSFAAPPTGLTNATVTNPLPFTTGADNETDSQLRIRVKNALASKGLGTATAVKSAVIGATPSDEQATVVSDDIVSTSYGSVLYIDDGTGYEAKSTGVGLESIVDSALGGEQFFQLATGGRQAPVAKAFLQSTLSAPFDLIGSDTLAVIVGGQTYQHTFATSDFRSPGSATAYEVTTSINADTTLGFEATTAGGGTYVVIRSKNEGNDTIKITTPTTSGRNAATQLGFSSGEIQTLRLFKNEIPLSKDGSYATIFTPDQQLWSSTIASGDTLVLSVDGTDPITYVISNSDFIATGLYTSVSASNSLESWVEVFNNKLTGVTAEVVGQQISISSNLNANSRASLVISSASTLVSKGMFTATLGLTAQGKTSDYTLDRNTAQFELAVPLVAGDKLAAGSVQTEGRVQGGAITAGSVTLSSPGYVWILIDEAGTVIPTGVAGSTVLGVSTPATNVVRYTSSVSSAFSNLQLGDYVIIWSAELPASDRLEGRVHAVTGSTLDILVTAAEYAAVTVTSGVVFSQGFVAIRTAGTPQKFEIPTGTSTLDQIATALQAQTPSLNFSVLEEEYLIVRTKTKDTTGSVLIVTADVQGQQLNLPTGSLNESKDSLIAYYDSQQAEGQLPLFIHSGFAADALASTPDSFIQSVVTDVNLDPSEPNNLITILHPYGTANDAQPAGETLQESFISGSQVGVAYPDTTYLRNLNVSRDVQRLRTIDRFFAAAPLDFGPSDTAVVIVDNNPNSGSFEIPMYRKALTNTTQASNANNFNAYDSAAGSGATFTSSFGATFDFSNFKALMLAKKVLKPSASQTALLYRSAQWGRSGEKITVGYSYPSAANSAIASTVTVSETVSILINLKSGAAVPTSIDGTTEWNVTVTANTPSTGIDQVTYTYSGTGTAPALSLSGGEYVNIGTQTELNTANTGIFKVSTQAGFTPTATSFTVQAPNGVAVAQTNAATVVPGAIVFYQASSTAASEINTYVNANLSSYVTSTIVNDGGTTGSGIISASTYEDSGFTYPSVQLQDGINWIAHSTLSGTPQFVFKLPLNLPTDVGYAFNNGEEVRLIPTTMDQVKRFASVLAVSGMTTVGTINVVDRASRLEFATDTLGSVGSIQIIGGLGNSYQAPVLDSATRVDNSAMSLSVNSVSGQGIQSGSWLKLQASTAQSKAAGYNVNTSVTISGSSPISSQSTIHLLNRNLTQRYFGKPRHHIRSQGRTFRIEAQGSLVCLSWDNVGSSPVFQKSTLNFNDASGGTLNVVKVGGSNDAQYVMLTGNANFNELSIGDLVTVSGMAQSANNGTFLVTGVSDNGSTLQVFNPKAVNQYSFGTIVLNTNAVSGDTFTVGSTVLTAGTSFAIGASAAATAINLSALIGTLSGVSSTVSGTTVTVTATSPFASVALAHTGSGTVTLSGSSLSGQSFSAGAFTASSQVSEGDTVIIGAPFNILNQGQYRVIRRYNDSIWFENANMVAEEVTLPFNGISLGFDTTTSFMVNATNDTQLLSWNGTGTEPTLGLAQVGDIVTFGSDFASANQGSYMVLRSSPSKNQIATLQIPTGAQLGTGGVGKYFLINGVGNVNQYYVWFNVDETNSDPSVGGKTGLTANCSASDSATVVANAVASALSAASGLTASASNEIVTVATTGSAPTMIPTNVSVPAPFTVTLVQAGVRTFLECVNPSAINQSSVTISGSTMLCHRPQIQFYEYDAIVPGDKIVITSNNFLAANVGSHVVAQVLDRDNAIVTGAMSSVNTVSLNGITSSFYNQEETPYAGYKHVSFVVAQPGTTNRNLITMDTNAQYDKINQAASVEMTSLNKLNFSSIIKNGLDSYRYNTGLIAEANRIIYGDPRDNATYPGVGAAGADIFVREPLSRRIQLAIDIRLNTGVPFAQTAEQVRNSVSSLINSNKIGQSIAISSIVSIVAAIPGILAVSISSPTYSPSSDVIVLAPGEKAFIIDPTIDISISNVSSQ